MVNIDLIIEIKRIEMYESIDKYGTKDNRTIKTSQELDELIVLKLKTAA